LTKTSRKRADIRGTFVDQRGDPTLDKINTRRRIATKLRGSRIYWLPLGPAPTFENDVDLAPPVR
jgi:hypothetical protein